MTMLRIYLIAGLLVTTLLGGLWLWGHEGHQKALQAANEAKVIATQRDSALEALRLFKRAADIEAETLRARATVAETQRAVAAKKLKDLNEALDGHPEWAGAPIPGSVLDSLDDPATAEAASAGSPPRSVPKAGAGRKDKPRSGPGVPQTR